jgi:hypothetical protein
VTAIGQGGGVEMGQWVESWGPGWRTVIVIDLEIGDGPSTVSMKQGFAEYHHVF